VKETMIALKNVSYTYPNGIKALNKVDVKIEEGEKVFIAGKTGSGKSTLLRLLNGLIPNFYGGKVEGVIHAFGKPSPKHVFFVSQHPEEQILMGKVRDEIALPLWRVGRNKVERKIEEVSEYCGIKKLLDKRTHRLSDGEKQLVTIATALASDAPCIALDEPFSHLHPEITKKILNLLLECDKTVVMSEHRIELAKKFDRVIWLEGKNNAKLENCVKTRLNEREDRRMDNTAVELDSISFGYNSKLFEGLNLKIMKNSVCAITGRNGSGKTTLLKIIAGLIKVEGVKVYGKVSIALQYPNYHFCEKKVEKEAKEKWIKLLGLEKLKDRHPHSLSGGEAKRLSIAKALDADIVLLDEPTAGQDYEFRFKLVQVLRELEKTVVIATHDERLASMCDEIVRL